MTRAELKKELANCLHQAWSTWMKELTKETRDIADYTGLATGDAVLPEQLLHKWGKEMITPYGELNDAKKDSYYFEIDKLLEVIDKFTNGESL